MTPITVPFLFSRETFFVDAHPDFVPSIEAAVRSLIPKAEFGSGPILRVKTSWKETGPKPLRVLVSLEGGRSWSYLDQEILDPRYQKEDHSRRVKERIRLGVQRVIEQTFQLSAGPWGILTGVRPTKLVHSLLDRGFAPQELRDMLAEVYGLNREKIELLLDVALWQRGLFPPSPNACISVYVGIPFCPTRCSYCSFAAYPLATHGHLMGGFLDALKQEIEAVGALFSELGIEVESVYLGGGTPTTVQGRPLAELLEGIREQLSTSCTKEFTVEAGRPETLSRQTLSILKNAGVDRISINPQSMHDQTLQAIGRQHSAEQIRTAFYAAREVGIPLINMDIILGLPGEDLDSVQGTLEEIGALQPDNLTVHSLALKRASALRRSQEYELVLEKQGEPMARLAAVYARDWGMFPYYLYRQRQILSDLENVGYSQAGRECLYNVQMMEERQTVIALGGGAITKLVSADLSLIRLANPKCPAGYAQRMAEDLNSKIEQIRQHFSL